MNCRQLHQVPGFDGPDHQQNWQGDCEQRPIQQFAQGGIRHFHLTISWIAHPDALRSRPATLRGCATCILRQITYCAEAARRGGRSRQKPCAQADRCAAPAHDRVRDCFRWVRRVFPIPSATGFRAPRHYESGSAMAGDLASRSRPGRAAPREIVPSAILPEAISRERPRGSMHSA